jgi:hypothetical protein
MRQKSQEADGTHVPSSIDPRVNDIHLNEQEWK